MTFLPEDPNPVTIRRYFPAEVLLPGAAGPVQALAVVTRVAVYVFTSPGDPVFTAVYDPEVSALRQEWEMRAQPAMLTTGVGDVYVNRERGCGCGNPLKTYQPFLPNLTAGA